jgi:putative heme transporter
VSDTANSDPSASDHSPPPPRSSLRAVWPWLKYAIGLGLAALAVWALLGRRGELSGASGYLAHMRWAWAVVAAVFEFASIVAFALVQQELLAAGDVSVPAVPITGITLAVTAIANSMPAGPVVSSVFAFRQYRRRGADEAVAGWTLAGVFVVASVTLALIAIAGLGIAGAEGADFNLVGVTVAVFVAALVLAVVFFQRRARDWLIEAALRATRRLFRWPRGDLGAHVDRIVAHLTAVRLTPARGVRVFAWAVANWLLDCGCLVVAFVALGVGVPWRGLLLAYGAGQLAANLPITPGGLGVVEGSLTIALVAFGGAENSTVAAVLLYRIISFWAELPVGWAAWVAFEWSGRRNQALADARRAEPEQVAEVLA